VRHGAMICPGFCEPKETRVHAKAYVAESLTEQLAIDLQYHESIQGDRRKPPSVNEMRAVSLSEGRSPLNSMRRFS
jgi:hypothetical protein